MWSRHGLLLVAAAILTPSCGLQFQKRRRAHVRKTMKEKSKNQSEPGGGDAVRPFNFYYVTKGNKKEDVKIVKPRSTFLQIIIKIF